MSGVHDLDQVGYVYFISSDDQEACKIGFATDPYQRWKTLQTGNPDHLTLRMTIPGTLGAEVTLHRLLKSRRRTLEWFWDRSDFMWLLEEWLEEYLQFKEGAPHLTADDVEQQFVEFMEDTGHRYPSEDDPALLEEIRAVSARVGS